MAAGSSFAQQSAPAQGQPTPQISVSGLKAIGNTPTPQDMYCSGFITTDKVPDHHYVAGGWNSPDQTRYAAAIDYVYIKGRDMKEGDRFQMVRPVKDPNHYELYAGQRAAVRDAGETYFELGYVRVIGVQRDVAIAVPELSCADIVPGDLAIPFVERPVPVFKKVSLDRFAPPNGKTTGRIILANEFDSYIGSHYKVYLNIGTDKGLKVGDYLRATRTYSYSYHDPEAGLSLKASAVEDTQKYPYNPASDVGSLPRRTLGDMIVLQVYRKSATAMVMDALEDIRVGDGVELMDVSEAPAIAPVTPASITPPGAPNAENALPAPPRIACSASPATVRVGESSTITCDASSPDNHPISITFVANGGKLSSSKNQATLDTSDTGAGPIAVRATAFDDRNLSAAAVTTVTVEAPPSAAPNAQKLSELDFKPNSTYVDNRSKAALDDVALKMQQDPGSTAVLTGESQPPEPASMANQRAQNAMDYLTKSKGIDPNRIQVKTGTEPGRKVDVWTVPAGATLPQQQPQQLQQPQQPQQQPPQEQKPPE